MDLPLSQPSPVDSCEIGPGGPSRRASKQRPILASPHAPSRIYQGLTPRCYEHGSTEGFGDETVDSREDALKERQCLK
jgi:hypothetical protein